MRLASRVAAAAGLLLTTAGALAHGGHGAAPLHWHATDTAGFVVVAVLGALAVWLSRGD
jgi:hypothetical protein